MTDNMPKRLAEFILKNVNLNFSTILEVGCGEGQLTLPFAHKINNFLNDFKIIAYDLSIGAYSESIEILKKNIQEKELENFIITVQGDVRDMKDIENESIDFIYSNELFCDLDRIGLEKALNEFYRVLKSGGQMAHAEFAPIAENLSQKLFIKADMHSLETSTPKPTWFSPFSDEVAVILHKIGFKDIIVKFFETGVHLEFDEAIKALKDWTVDPKFIRKHKDEIYKYGIESPLEHVIFCHK